MVTRLQDEIKQRKPFRSLREEALLNIARTAAALEHEVAQALKPYDITPTQYNVLRILRGAGAEGLCRNEVGARLIRRVPDVTRLLDRMEETGLLVRQRSGTDRRYVTTTIAKKGLDLLARLEGPITEIHRAQLGHVAEARLRTLVDLLDEVRSRP
ncbi:MAG: MarR family transcriptional regulator [Vicinamibacterales bacterium]|nr:MarR family transcriptional regulator [Vicinamibacterales bacterium]